MINLIEISFVFIGAGVATYSYSYHSLKKIKSKEVVK